jgi:hypothetical protein
VVVLFSFDIVTNVLISPCIFLLIAYIIWHLPQNLNTSSYNCVSNCQEYSLKWINKTAGFVKCFFSGIFADSKIFYARHFNFFFKQKKYKTDMCSCYKIARFCKLQKMVHWTRSRKW